MKNEPVLTENIKTEGAGQSRALGLFLLKRYEEAVDEYERLCAENPDDIILWTNKMVARSLVRTPDADFFSQMQKRVRELPAAGYLCVAELLIGMEAFGQALVFLNQAIAKDPANVEAYLLKTVALSERGDTDAIFETMKSIYPRFKFDDRVLCAVALFADMHKNVNQAHYFLKKALKVNRKGVLCSEVFRQCFEIEDRAEKLIPFMTEALQDDPNNPELLRALAHAYNENAEFEKSQEIFAKLASLYPGGCPENVKIEWAEVLEYQGEYVRAYDLAHTLADQTGAIPFMSKMLYLIYNFFSKDEARNRAARWRKEHPDDAGVNYIAAAILGEDDVKVPPLEYIENVFDTLSESFDVRLVDGLDYKGPEVLEKALRLAKTAPACNKFVLDAGCGTGLCASVLTKFMKTGAVLKGVDLSSGMLSRALEKNLYTSLECADLVSYLNETADRFDLIVCMDVLTYFGDLQPVFDGFARCLNKRGTLIFCVQKPEKGLETEYELTPAGRFVHGLIYVSSALKKAGLTEKSVRVETLRFELDNPVDEYVFTVEAP